MTNSSQMGGNKNSPIGVFDSGVGGLTVVRALQKALPNEDLLYFGDSAHVPYGNKSEETIVRYSLRNAKFLTEQGVKMVVVACNTSTATALPALRKSHSIPLYGVIEPGCKQALAQTTGQNIGVIGTKRTIASGAYSKLLRGLRPSVRVVEKACPLFVPLIEEGFFLHGELCDLLIRDYLESMRPTIDTLILGCTHYALLKDSIKKTYPEWQVVDSAGATAVEVRNLLDQQNLLSSRTHAGHLNITTNDRNETFVDFARSLFPDAPIIDAKPS